jgi:hypothetical protein
MKCPVGVVSELSALRSRRVTGRSFWGEHQRMTKPRSHPHPAVERAMKVQELIRRATAGRLKWYEAAQIL